MANSSIGSERSTDNGEVDSSILSSPTNFTTKQSGDLSEMKFVVWCLERGLGVSIPVGDRLPYDVVVDVNGRLLKVQVKTGWRRSDSALEVTASSTTTENGKWVYRSYEGKVDGIVCYDSQTYKFYYLKANQIEGITRSISLRIKPTQNRQSRKVRLATDYELLSVDQLF